MSSSRIQAEAVLYRPVNLHENLHTLGTGHLATAGCFKCGVCTQYLHKYAILRTEYSALHNLTKYLYCTYGVHNWFTSWSDGKATSLDLLFEPRRGFTQKLRQYSKNSDKASIMGGTSDWAAWNQCACKTVLMVASGFGVVVQLPYLKNKQLIHGCKRCKTRTSRIHLVWQSKTFGRP